MENARPARSGAGRLAVAWASVAWLVGGVPAPASMVEEAPAIGIVEAPPVRLVRTTAGDIFAANAHDVAANANDVAADRGGHPASIDARGAGCRGPAGRLGQGQCRHAERDCDSDHAKTLHDFSP